MSAGAETYVCRAAVTGAEGDTDKVRTNRDVCGWVINPGKISFPIVTNILKPCHRKPEKP